MAYGNGYDIGGTAAVTSYSGASATTLAVAPKQTPVQMELNGAEKRLAELHAALSELESRLMCVLSPEPPSATGIAGHGPTNQIVGQIVTLNNSISAATARVSSLLSRLEV